MAQLAREGVATHLIAQSEDETPGVALIVVGAEDGENQIVTVAGSNGTLPVDQVEAPPLAGGEVPGGPAGAAASQHRALPSSGRGPPARARCSMPRPSGPEP